QKEGQPGICNPNFPGNLGVSGSAGVDESMQARHEQLRSIQLPDNAELCDLNIDMISQSFYYDDIIFLSLNGIILASNHKAALEYNLNKIPITIGSQNTGVLLYEYDWSRLVGKPFSNSSTDPQKKLVDYCAGTDLQGSTCIMPYTQQQSNLDLSYDPELLIHIGARSPNSVHTFNFSVTGDNDETTDCYHSGFEFDVQAKYYVKAP
ncbi:MAG: hypothetical protein KDD34_07905, partial [Bdellovibrionales bacterium]|nr:hypothetical protein [Bdellovibrionales bacterium]